MSEILKTTMEHLHNGILLDYKKEENFTLCDSMDGTGEHYAKWNKPVRERQILSFHLSLALPPWLYTQNSGD